MWEVCDSDKFDENEDIRIIESETAAGAAMRDLNNAILEGIVDRGYEGTVYVRPLQTLQAFKQSYQATIKPVDYKPKPQNHDSLESV